MAHFTNAFGQEENLIVGTRVREGEHKNWATIYFDKA